MRSTASLLLLCGCIIVNPPTSSSDGTSEGSDEATPLPLPTDTADMLDGTSSSTTSSDGTSSNGTSSNGTSSNTDGTTSTTGASSSTDECPEDSGSSTGDGLECFVDPATERCGCIDQAGTWIPDVAPEACYCAMYPPGVCWCGSGCLDCSPGPECLPWPDSTCA